MQNGGNEWKFVQKHRFLYVFALFLDLKRYFESEM